MFSSNFKSPRHTEALCIVRGQDCGDSNQGKLEIAPWVSLQLLRGWWRPRNFHGPHMHSHGVHLPGDHLQSKGTTHYLSLLTWRKEDIEAQFQSHNSCQVVWKKKVKVLITQFSSVAQSCSILCNPMDSSPPGSSCTWGSPRKNTGVVCHFLLQGTLPTKGSNLGLLHCRFFAVWSIREVRLCESKKKKYKQTWHLLPRGNEPRKDQEVKCPFLKLSGVALGSLEWGTWVREKAPGGEHGNPLQHSCLENPTN